MIRTNLIWFRRDLRCLDNPALIAAAQSADAVVAVFYFTPEQWRQHNCSFRQLDLIRRRLEVLKGLLAEKNISLVCRSVERFADIAEDLSRLCGELQVRGVYCEAESGLDEARRDEQVANRLNLHGVSFQQLGWPTILPPGTVVNGKGQSYRVFSAFKRAWLKQFLAEDTSPRPEIRTLIPLSHIPGTSINPSFPGKEQLSSQFAVDDKAIRQSLNHFIDSENRHYHQLRDFPDKNATSRFSPWLATGMLSPRQVVAAFMANTDSTGSFDQLANDTFVGQLIWREFFHHLLWYFPRLCQGKPFLEWTENLRWKDDEERFSRWKSGMTGFPIVDAAMRQLKQEGWLHNRLRMIVASFLCKDLLIDWRKGEQWFMQQLIDGDFAVNNGSWQWCASTGTDAQPYFRVFNPTRQGERFDPEGSYVKRWLPELASIPEKMVHIPHIWAEKSGIRLDYPLPVVDHKTARVQAVEAYKKARVSYR